MYADLPDKIKDIIFEYLLADDFRTAKQIYDQWNQQLAENLPNPDWQRYS